MHLQENEIDTATSSEREKFGESDDRYSCHLHDKHHSHLHDERSDSKTSDLHLMNESCTFSSEWLEWHKQSHHSCPDSPPPPQLILITPPSSPDSCETEIPKHQFKNARRGHHYEIKDSRRLHSRRRSSSGSGNANDNIPLDSSLDVVSREVSEGASHDDDDAASHHRDSHGHRHHHHRHHDKESDAHARRHSLVTETSQRSMPCELPAHCHHHHEKEPDSHLHRHSVVPETSQRSIQSEEGLVLEREMQSKLSLGEPPSRLDLERHSRQHVMADDDYNNDDYDPSQPPRRWTEFEYESDSYHLSNRHLDEDDDSHTDHYGFPIASSSTLKPQELGFPMRASTLPIMASHSKKLPHASATSPRPQSDATMDYGLKKRWSPKRLICGSTNPDNRGAFPTIHNSQSGALLPPPPEFSRRRRVPTTPRARDDSNASHVSLQSAPAMYVSLDSKKHVSLDEFQRQRQAHHHHLHSRQHQEFKQTMKKLLEEEYSPYYVKKGPPSILSVLTASTKSDESEASYTTDATAWKSPPRRRMGLKRQWFERSESKRGKMVSTKPRSMDLVFFPTIPEEKEVGEVQKEEERECKEQSGDAGKRECEVED